MVTSLLWLFAPALAAPTVKLIEAGAEPRAPLRLEVAPGRTSVVDIRMATHMDLGMGGAMSMPPMRMALRFDTRGPSGDGVAYGFQIVEADVQGGDPMLSQALGDALRPMVGFAGEAVIDPRGNTSGLVMKPPPGLPSQLSGNLDRSLTMVGAPLPAEPVGVGARWTLDQDVEQQGLTVHQSTTWTLVSRDGPAVVLDTVITQRADPQQIQDPSLPPGSKVTLTSFHSTGSGRSELDLRSLVPSSAIMKMDLKMGMEAMVEGLSMPMDMTMAVEMSLAKRASEER